MWVFRRVAGGGGRRGRGERIKMEALRQTWMDTAATTMIH